MSYARVWLQWIPDTAFLPEHRGVPALICPAQNREWIPAPRSTAWQTPSRKKASAHIQRRLATLDYWEVAQSHGNFERFREGQGQGWHVRSILDSKGTGRVAGGGSDFQERDFKPSLPPFPQWWESLSYSDAMWVPLLLHFPEKFSPSFPIGWG